MGCLPYRKQRRNFELPLERYAAIATVGSSVIPDPGGARGGSDKRTSMNSGCGLRRSLGQCTREAFRSGDVGSFGP
jgi:hypothetical protein